ncbi:hypothetical protein N9X20_05335 [Opitutales bacterium]|nr:hypothetical protein [Opitutales bacterium]
MKVLLFSEPGNAGVKRHVLDVLNRLHNDEFEFVLVYSLRRAGRIYRDEIAQLVAMGVQVYEVDIGT